MSASRRKIAVVSLLIAFLLSTVPIAQAQTRLPNGLLLPKGESLESVDIRSPLPEASGAEPAGDPPIGAAPTKIMRTNQFDNIHAIMSEQKELTDKRTRNSRTFLNPDGTTRLETSPYPIHYLEGQTWKTIDTTILQDETGGFTHSMLANQFKVRFNGKSGQAAVSFAFGSSAVTYKPLFMRTVVGRAEQDLFIYSDAWTSTDMQYKVDSDRLKMELHLKDDKAPLKFSFGLSLQGVTPSLNKDGSIDFLDPTGKALFRIPRMWVQDASSSNKRYDRLKVHVRQTGKDTIIDIALDNRGLQYPIIIDPSSELVFQTVYNEGVYYLYDNAHRLSQTVSKAGTMDYTYDRNGNLLQRQSSANLIANGGFEIYTGTNLLADAWNKAELGTSPDIKLVDSPMSGGRRAHKITDSGLAVDHYSGLYQKIKVEPNRAFTASTQVLVTSLTHAQALLYVTFLDASNQYAGGFGYAGMPVANGIYTTLTSNGTTPSSAAYAYVYVILFATANGGSGTFYSDMVNFRYDTEANVLTNPSFEFSTGANKAADGWMPFQYYATSVHDHRVVLTPVSGGRRSHRIADSSLPAIAYSGIYQFVQVNPGQLYTGYARVNVENLANASFWYYYEFYDAQQQYVGGNLVSSTASTNGRYETVSINGTTPATAAYVVVYLLLSSESLNSSGVVHVDMINFKMDSTINKIANGGFETFSQPRVADGWTEIAQGDNATFASSTAYAWNGLKSQFVAGSGMSNGEMTGVSQDIRIGAASGYTSSGKFLITSLNNAKVQFYIDFYNNQDQLTGSTFAEYSNTTNFQWFNFYANGTTPANTAYARVYARLLSTGSNGYGSFFVDAVQVQ